MWRIRVAGIIKVLNPVRMVIIFTFMNMVGIVMIKMKLNYCAGP